jgi:hypothetical protein
VASSPLPTGRTAASAAAFLVCVLCEPAALCFCLRSIPLCCSLTAAPPPTFTNCSQCDRSVRYRFLVSAHRPVALGQSRSIARFSRLVIEPPSQRDRFLGRRIILRNRNGRQSQWRLDLDWLAGRHHHGIRRSGLGLHASARSCRQHHKGENTNRKRILSPSFMGIPPRALKQIQLRSGFGVPSAAVRLTRAEEYSFCHSERSLQSEESLFSWVFIGCPTR